VYFTSLCPVSSFLAKLQTRLKLCSGFPCRIESIENVLNFEISFQNLGKVLHLTKTYKVLKKYGNSKFSRLLIQILFVTAYDSSAEVFCIVFHQQNFRKMKLNVGIKVF